jgi:hypothetical protein
VAHFGPLLIVELSEIRIDNHVASVGRDFVATALNLEIPDGTFNSIVGFTFEPVTSIHPIIIQLAK